MSKQKLTRKEYEEYLNEVGKSLPEEEFIIGGKQRPYWGKYGSFIRRYDPIAFEVGYSDWKREKLFKNEKL